MMRSLFLFALAALAAPLSAQVPALIPVEHFAAQPAMTDPVLSPDGKRVVAIANKQDANRLALIDTARPADRPKIFNFGKYEFARIRWAGNNRLLATIATKATLMGTTVPVTRLAVIDVNSGKAWMADSKSKGLLAGDVVYTDPTGSWALVSSQTTIYDSPSVKRVELATGDAIEVEKQRPDVWDWYADENGTVRGGIAYDERRWKLWYRERPGEPLRAVRGKFASDDDSAVDKVIFSRDKSRAAIITNEKTGRFALYEYDLAAGEVGRPIYEHPVSDIDEVWSDTRSGEILGVRFHDSRWRTHWIDAKLKSVQARVDRALPDQTNEIIGKSLDSDMVLVKSVSASDPGTYYLLDLKQSKMSPVMLLHERIEAQQLAPVKAVNYAARDGLNIPAYLTLPKGRAERGLPLILMPHGGPFARDEWQYDPLVQFMANRGYAVLQPQFRGTTGYGRQFVERGYGEWGRKMQDDLDDGVDWLARQGIIDPKRVCIVGASYGGYAALWGAIRNPDRYRCAASMAGVTDIGMQLKVHRQTFAATRYFKAWRTKVRGEGKFDLKSVSPLTHAARLRIPVLVAHGEQDDTVPVQQGRLMVAALTRAGADVTSVFYTEGGHSLSRSEDLADLLSRLATFLARYNPASPQDRAAK